MSDEGRLIAGRYRLLDRIGRGGMGTVWRAHDDLLARQVAVKKLHPQPQLDDHELAILFERTRREARSAARISHPNVIVVHDVVVDAGLPAIVMEYVPSTTLADLTEKHGPVPPEEAARIGREVLAALRAAHRAGILHRDVKPANVLLAEDGRVVLTDFGIAQASETSALTRTGQLVGSVDFIAPERLVGAPPGPEADLWGLGATLFQAVDGRSPFLRDSVTETMYAIAMEPVPQVRSAGPLTPLIQGLLAGKPSERLSAEDAERLLRMPAGGRTAADDAATPMPVPALGAASGPDRKAEPGSGLAIRGASAAEVPAPGVSAERPPAGTPDPRGKGPAGRWRKPTVLAAAAAVMAVLITSAWLVLATPEKNSDGADVTASDSPLTVGDANAPNSPATPVASSPVSSPSSSASSGSTAGSGGASPTVPAPSESTPESSKETVGQESGDEATSPASGFDSSDARSGRPLVVAASGKCLSGGAGTEGVQLFQATCDGSATQRWQIGSDGTVRSSGKCMTAAGGATDSRTEVQLTGCDGRASQEFRLAGTELRADQAQMCVDIFGGASGTGAVLFECNGRDNQTWTLG
ncbi:protein kinase domain-containing protein [Streptomyces turgidiscabies]|uniref:non-specific serine/threonine protein kinase n=1 Tax=Streptomyces turgidiscabies (strain Car8) TaxID=698760 RepID=L7ET12_STRT8|nr:MULTISPECIES: serine/threonine protein kinase [Streptomyces]ELP61856.1 kinase domain protein [Streptomyces turgidiscabies Car8]MDX3496535.1 protein kinase [Streptomyces turgidiscabies]GAQ72725.1 serine/threonine-protein kinase StkP [Streptomyces turgidiscabies]